MKCVIEGLYPIEIKKGIRTERADKNFNLLNKYGLPVMPGIVIDNSEIIRPINDKAYIAPIGMLE